MCDDEFAWVADPDVVDPRVADWISDVDFAKAEEDRRLLGKIMALTARVHELEERVASLEQLNEFVRAVGQDYLDLTDRAHGATRGGAMAARRAHYPEVAGSIPAPATYPAEQERIGG